MGILPSLIFHRLELYRWWGCVLGCIFQAHMCRGREMLHFLLVLALDVLIAMHTCKYCSASSSCV